MDKVIWDIENEQIANNWDGSEPEIDGDMIFIKELGCHCAPPGCGGCINVIVRYEIGKSQYVWKEI